MEEEHVIRIIDGSPSAERGLDRTWSKSGDRGLLVERRLDTEITHPIFGYKISYRRVFEVQARLLSRVLLWELKITRDSAHAEC